MTKRQRLLLTRRRRQACETNRRADVRAPKPLGFKTWLVMRAGIQMPLGARHVQLARDICWNPCCWKLARHNLGRLKAHLVAKHGMSSDWSGFADFEAEYVAAVLGAAV